MTHVDSGLLWFKEAQAAQRLGHKYKLDKNHVFLVSMFDDFEKYEKVPEQYTAPNLPDYEDQVWNKKCLHHAMDLLHLQHF